MILNSIPTKTVEVLRIATESPWKSSKGLSKISGGVDDIYALFGVQFSMQNVDKKGLCEVWFRQDGATYSQTINGTRALPYVIPRIGNVNWLAKYSHFLLGFFSLRYR